MVFTSGCDFLDVNPRTEVPADKIFTTEDGFEDALNGCYMKIDGKNQEMSNSSRRLMISQPRPHPVS